MSALEQAARDLATLPAGESLRFTDARNFLAIEFPPRQPIVEPFLCGQGTAMIYGPRGVGKTYVSVGLAVAIASGADFLRWRIPHAKGVLFLDGELPGGLLQDRIQTALATLDCDTEAPLKIHNPDDQDELCAALTDDIEVVILDNLSTLCRGGRENDADDWQASQDFILRLRRMGKAVILIHHAGKGGQQRGTSRREDILDTVINLKRPSDYMPSEGARFEVHYEKARGFFGADAAPFLAQLDQFGEGMQWTTLDMEESRAQQVARLINEGLEQHEIAKELDIHKSNVSRALKRAREEGLVSEKW